MRAGRSPLIAIVGLAALAVVARAQDAPEGPIAPLFAAHEPLAFTLEADLELLDGDRGEESPERPAVVLLEREGQPPLRLDAQVRTRGNFRLRRRTCEMPNLRLNLREGQLEGTVLAGQDKLKMVGYCRDRDEFEQNALEEYLVYRAYGVLTDVSFRVRPARITWVDTSGEREPVTRWGFLIEDDQALAERLGGERIEVPSVPPQLLDPESSLRMALFQYMVGNTDWSMVQFHNMEIVRLPDGRHVPVPYDFDFSGLVDADYASPDPSLGTSSVRERVYRGFCWTGVDVRAAYQLFLGARDRIEALFAGQEGLEERNARRALDYLGDFFEVIGDERRARSSIERACRSMGSG